MNRRNIDNGPSPVGKGSRESLVPIKLNLGTKLEIPFTFLPSQEKQEELEHPLKMYMKADEMISKTIDSGGYLK